MTDETDAERDYRIAADNYSNNFGNEELRKKLDDARDNLNESNGVPGAPRTVLNEALEQFYKDPPNPENQKRASDARDALFGKNVPGASGGSTLSEALGKITSEDIRQKIFDHPAPP